MASLMAFLGLDATNFHAGLRNAQNATSNATHNFVSSLGGLATGAIAGFGMTSLVHSAIEAAETIHKLSQEFRVSTDTIQIWERGAHRVGLGAEDIGNAMNRLKKAREDALAKGDPGGFSAFGVTMFDLADKAKDAEAILRQMGEFTAGHPITAEQDVAGMELMGRSGAKILSAMEQIQKMGPISLIAHEDIEQLHEAERILGRFKAESTVKTASILSAIPVAFKGWKDILLGNKTFPEAFPKAGETGNVAAPQFDLKGRPLTKEASAEAASAASIASTHAAQKKEAQVQKELLDIGKQRDALAQKILDNQLKAMPLHQREATIKKEIAEHERQADFLMRFGNESLSISERMKAEELRGRLKDNHKFERMDFNSSEKIGGFNAFSFGSPLHSAGMDHAAKTAQNTEKMAQTLAALEQYAKGYSLDPNNDRTKHTHDVFKGARF